MARVNWARIVLGGLLAGVVVNAVEFVVNGLVLRQNWADAMTALGKPGNITGGQIAIFNLWGFVFGITAVWLYAAIRPSYGGGPKTAAIAGFVVWVLGYFLAGVAPLVLGVLPVRLMLVGFAAGLVESIGGTILGAWLYREPGAVGQMATARAA